MQSYFVELVSSLNKTRSHLDLLNLPHFMFGKIWIGETSLNQNLSGVLWVRLSASKWMWLVLLFKFLNGANACWFADCSSGWLEGPNKVYIPFLACGDLRGYDSDRSYPLPKVADGTYQSLDPVQPPIAPPYKRALELKKATSQGIRELENISLDSWSCYKLFIHN